MLAHRSRFKITRLVIVWFLLLTLLNACPNAVTAQVAGSSDRSQGKTLVVENTSDVINGDYTNPTTLIANPGTDGISLPEAIAAVDNANDFYAITFDPALSGSTIYLTHDMPHINRGNLSINGDINEDGTPDITIDGSDADFNCFNIVGGSNVVIRGINIHNFPKHGVYVNPDSDNGRSDLENITIYQNDIIATEAAISLSIYGQASCSISNVEINGNALHNGVGGISIIAGIGANAVNNQITNVTILDNSIDSYNWNNDIFISPAADIGLSGNTVSDIVIRGNHITGQNDSSIIVDASNQSNCSNNTLDRMLITDNYIEGIAVGIELVGESGSFSTSNLMTDVTISDNTLIGCGIHVAGSTGYNAHWNTISYLTIERNFLDANGVSGTANGIYLAAGADGAYENVLEDLVIRDNFINGFADAGILMHGNNALSPNNAINRVTLLNQTITNNAIENSWASGINVNTRDISNTITNVTIKNSILWGNGGGDSIKGSITPEVVTNSILNDIRFTGSNGNFYGNPEFVDSSSVNYHLQSTSPCIDTGDLYTPSPGIADLDLNERVVDGNGDVLPVIDLGAWEFGATAVQEISILGNGETIFNGDTLPATWDGTDFEWAEIGGASAQSTFTIENLGDSAILLTGTNPVEITGDNAGDFSVITQPADSINGGQSVTFTIEFTPSAAGLREATVHIASNDYDEVEFIFAIQGIGEEPPPPQEIVVLGNGEEILNGDTTPSIVDHTDFGSTEMAGDSLQSTFTIQNTGGIALELTSADPVEIIGDNAGDFSVITQPSAMIAGGLSSTFIVEFNPSAIGLRKAAIQIANNDSDEGEYIFSIQGYALEPEEIAVSGNAIAILDGDITPSTADGTDFGDAVIGFDSVQKTFTIENTGEVILTLNGNNPVEILGYHAGDFTVITPPDRVINGGQSTTFTIEFTPSEIGSRVAEVVIPNTDSDEGMFSFAIQGNGMEPPTEQEIVVLGNGQEITDCDNTPSSLDDTDFGTLLISGGYLQHTFTIHNTGENTLILTGTVPVEITGANTSDFYITALPSTSIEGGQSTTFTIEFNPTTTGLRTVTVRIPNNDADEGGFTFAIQGYGAEPPEIAVSGNGNNIINGDNIPSTLDGTDFGNAEIGGDSNQTTFTIENIGGLQLELTGINPIEIAGPDAVDFSVVTQPADTINGGQSTTFTIEFSPSDSGTRIAIIQIPNNDADEGGFSFTIQGNGEESGSPQEIVILGNSIEISDGDNTPSKMNGTDFGDAEVGGEAVQFSFTIQNIGDAPLELTAIIPVELTGANASDFTVISQPATTINGGETATFTISFTPSGLGLHEATIHIPNNDADEGGYFFVIQGNGVEDLEDEFHNFIPIFL